MKVTSGVETDWQKPGYHSATEEDKIAPLYIMTLHFLAYIRQKRIIVYSVLCMYASHRKISVKQRYVKQKRVIY